MARPIGVPPHEAKHISGGGDPFGTAELLEAVVKRLRTGSTDLLVGTVADGEFLKRVGTAIVSAAGGSTEVHTVNGLRLSASSSESVPTSDVATTTSVYLVPHKSNEIWLRTSGTWTRYAVLTYVTLALGTLSNATNYRVWAYDSGGSVALEAHAWTNNTTPPTTVAQDGVWCKSGALDRRYVGDFRTISTTQTTDTGSQRFVFSADNRVLRVGRQKDTASWTHASTSWAALNGGDSHWKVEFLIGLDENAEQFDVSLSSETVSGSAPAWSVGLDSTTAQAADASLSAVFGAVNVGAYGTSTYLGRPGLGYHYLNGIQSNTAAVTTTYWSDVLGPGWPGGGAVFSSWR